MAMLSIDPCRLARLRAVHREIYIAGSIMHDESSADRLAGGRSRTRSRQLTSPFQETRSMGSPFDGETEPPLLARDWNSFRRNRDQYPYRLPPSGMQP